jgi:hypothetical protein
MEGMSNMELQNPHEHALLAMKLLHSILPVVTASFYLTASFAATLYPPKEPPGFHQARSNFRITIGSMMLGIFATYVWPSSMPMALLFSGIFESGSTPQFGMVLILIPV